MQFAVLVAFNYWAAATLQAAVAVRQAGITLQFIYYNIID